jgi:hypothetical protein
LPRFSLRHAPTATARAIGIGVALDVLRSRLTTDEAKRRRSTMSQAELFALLSSDDLFFDHDDLAGGFHKARGSHTTGCWEPDPEMNEYEETIELAEALAAMEW